MATSLLALLDDITTLLDDVSAMTKVAVKKTSGVLGDDLALNAQQVTGVNADRELPVVWAVAKGSMLNKAILVPLALLISAFAPWLITPLMMVGGAFLCFEGFEKVAHKLLHKKEEDEQHHIELVNAVEDETVDMVQFEKDKVKGAIRTDFILSAEIIVLSLGSAAAASFSTQVMVLIAIAIVMTVGVYGLVAGIVKLDDFGLYLMQKSSAAARSIGRAILASMPWLMRGLSFFGTLAMFLVGGGILAHGIAPLMAWLHQVELTWGGLFGSLAAMGANLVVGIIAGSIVLAVVTLVQKVRR